MMIVIVCGGLCLTVANASYPVLNIDIGDDKDPHSGFTFYMTPPPEEQEDYEHMARGFPCESHE
jgi:hypothetical protein